MIFIRRDKKVWKSIEKRHYDSLISAPYGIPFKIKAEIKRKALSKYPKYKTLLRKLLRKNELRKLLTGKPKQLEKFIESFNPTLVSKSGKNIQAIHKSLNRIFDYSLFSNNRTQYGAYSLVSALDIKTCPYCNTTVLNFLLDEGGKTRARLDHWFNQAKYPYLAVSLYNLIPSCTPCNSDLKNQKTFSIKTHLHPFTSGYENVLLFKTGINKSDYASGNIGSFSLSLNYNWRSTTKDSEVEKSWQTAQDFNIQKIYDTNHRVKAGEMIENSDLYSAVQNEKLNHKQRLKRTLTQFIWRGLSSFLLVRYSRTWTAE